MDNVLTIVMFHYVRDLSKSKYPKLKALDLIGFKHQIDYFSKFYNFVTIHDCIEAIYEGKQLLKNSILLTFDDGYSDHFINVFPILKEKGIQGAFFIPGKPIVENKVLQVNKIQFVLATAPGTETILKEIFKYLELYKREFSLLTGEDYYEKLAHADYFDAKDVVFIKKMLSMELPLECRERIANKLFEKYVTDKQESFAKTLYLSKGQIKEMIHGGMYIGCHGYNHLWLGEVSREEQEKDIDRALDFLEGVGANIDEWAMTYPYESYNDSLIKVIAERGCKLGFIEEEDIALLDAKNAFTLVRLDTNEFPKAGDSSPNKWTKRVLQ